MRDALQFYIGGEWVAPAGSDRIAVINPATEQTIGSIAAGNAVDVDRAVEAARRTFPAWAATSRAQRLALLQAIAAEYEKRAGDLADAVSAEMGAPVALATGVQVPIGSWHLSVAASVLEAFAFEEDRGSTRIVKEPIGVCGLITPWNWPLNQILCKVAPALATGCTMVLKPSEVAPFTGQIVAEIMHAAGVPAGVFNLVHGTGEGVGAPLAAHRDVDMMSFTGSTRAGVAVAQAAAPTVKRVCQELGGKSPLIILDDQAFADSVAGGVAAMMSNSGQSCNAPSRMLVPVSRMREAADIAAEAARAVTVGDPASGAEIGPVASKAQFDKISNLIEAGIGEGARLVAGGPGRPEGLATGYYVRPTVFADVDNAMRIAREEIFGPVLVLIGYDGIDDAIRIANDTDYGLAAYVNGADLDQARAISARLRAGQVTINGAFDIAAPFGGYKQSGNGREWGDFAFHDFLEVKAVLGHSPEAGT